MTTPMLPGLGGGTGGVQLSPSTPLTTPTINNNLAPGGHTTALPGGNAAPILSAPGAVQPSTTTTLPTPTINNNLSPTGHTTALPGQNTPLPAQTVTQMLNNPSLITPATTDLAAKYGTMGATSDPTAIQSIADKYKTLYDKVQAAAAPATNPMRSDEIKSQLAEIKPPAADDAQKSFIDNYASLNPIQKSIVDASNEILSSANTHMTFEQEYTNLLASSGIPALNTKLMNINNIMDGTEDDIRNEVTKAGGFATESQVAALTASRNKVLLIQAKGLQDQLNTANDYVDHIMQYSKLDRDEVTAQVNQKLGILDKLDTMNTKIETAAKGNYQKIIDAAGYTGLAQILQQSPDMISSVEKTLGLPAGTMSNMQYLATLDTERNTSKNGTWTEPYSLGGSLVQRNSLTGEVRTAVNPPNPTNASATATEGQDLADAKTYLTAHPGVSPEDARQIFLSKHPSAAAAWDSFFGVDKSTVGYPQAPASTDKPWWQFW